MSSPPPAEPLTLAIVEDYELVAMGLRQMLAPHRSRIAVLDPVPARTAPRADLVLIEPCGALADPAHAARILAGVALGRRLVVYTWSPSAGPTGVERLLAAGWPIHGWLSKTLPADDLVRALERIHHGQFVVLDQESSRRSPPEAVIASSEVSCPLTTRESDVIAMIAQGLTNQQIADITFLSLNTVKTYIRSSYRKMGVTRRTQAVLWSVHHGLHLSPGQGRARAPR